MPKFDAVVIGAGNGGLAAACRMAKGGKKTLLIERHNMPGGCASSFRRGRFEFETALHEICEWGTKENPGGCRKTCEEFGLDIPWHMVPDNFRVITTASDGRQELPELLDAFSDAEPGPVKRTAELGDTLAYLAGQYMLSLAPEYQGGQLLSSWDETLFWLYKIGISRGNLMTREQVEAALSDLLGYTKAAAHQSTSHFTLTEEGYVPQDVASARPLPFSVKALEKGEGQDWEALLEQEDGTAVTLTLTLEEDTVRFSSISHTGGSL